MRYSSVALRDCLLAAKGVVSRDEELLAAYKTLRGWEMKRGCGGVGLESLIELSAQRKRKSKATHVREVG